MDAEFNKKFGVKPKPKDPFDRPVFKDFMCKAPHGMLSPTRLTIFCVPVDCRQTGSHYDTNVS